MELRVLRWSAHLGVIGLLCALGACTSSPSGATKVGYAVTPLTALGPPNTFNIFFQANRLASVSGGVFRLSTEPTNGHIATGCTGTTTFDGAEMTIDWACGTTSMLTISGTLLWEDGYYLGDCLTSYTSSAFSFANVLVPFKAEN